LPPFAPACPALPPQPAAGYDQTGQTFAESPSLAQPSDSAASGFYVSNPNNRLTNNAASGGYSGGRGRRQRQEAAAAVIG
jgi:hypothetical protein